MLAYNKGMEGLSMQRGWSQKGLEEFFAWVRNMPSVGSENWKYGLVLMGFLVEYLLNRQMEKKGYKPFWKNLEDLRMRWEELLKLLPKLRQGLEDYGAFDEPMVREVFWEISEALLQSTKPKASVKELNFYLASGMGLYDRYRDILRREEFPCLIATL
jgi:CRISPR-associated protein Cas8b/Csh1 subtype I-B